MKKYYLIFIIFFITTVYSQNNLLRVVALNYKLQKINNQYDHNFSYNYPYSNQLLDVIVGNEWEGFKPVGIFQNVSDTILTFKVRCKINNDDVNKIIYNRNVTVSDDCLKASAFDSVFCNEDPFIKVRYCDVQEVNGYFQTTPLPYPGENNLTGIPPGGFVEVEFPPFIPNDFLSTHKGQSSIYLSIIPIVPETGDTLREETFSDDTLTCKLNLRKPDCAELYYPLDGDTIKSGDNIFYSMTNSNTANSEVLTFASDPEFNSTSLIINKLKASNLNFEQNKWYYWHLEVNAQDTSCTSETRRFYVLGGTSVSDNYEINQPIFPNPAMEYITLNVPPLEKRGLGGVLQQIRIFDIFGDEMHPPRPSGTPQEGNIRIDITTLQAGVYFVRIGNEKPMKFVVVR